MSQRDFNPAYEGVPPWDIGRPQPVFADLAAAGALRGRVLDVGCGTGEHALLAASLGLEAVGVDLAPRALEKARAKAAERGLTATFLLADALELGALKFGVETPPFDVALDCGVFHVFDDEDRPAYAASLAHALVPGGRCYLLCFSEHQPGDFGPRRVTQAEIRATFADGWRVDAIEAAPLEVNLDSGPISAWLATLTRELRGPRVVLRPVEEADLAALLTIRQEPAVMAWWGSLVDPPEDEFLDEDVHAFVIEVDGAMAGCIEYGEEDSPDYRHASIDVFLGTAHQGKGYGPEALRILIRHLFDDLGHHRITIDPATANTNAIRAYQRVGFRPVGVMRDYERAQDGTWHDGLLMDLLAGDLT